MNTLDQIFNSPKTTQVLIGLICVTFGGIAGGFVSESSTAHPLLSSKWFLGAVGVIFFLLALPYRRHTNTTAMAVIMSISAGAMATFFEANRTGQDVSSWYGIQVSAAVLSCYVFTRILAWLFGKLPGPMRRL